MLLTNKVVVITGAGSGVGRASARRFGEEGMKVVLADVLGDPLDQVVSALRADGFFAGPSNFLFAASKGLTALGVPSADLHMNRGDGDGPVNL